ncbi:MAG: hypothetical protein IJU50_00575 [Lachnospiraceae bacterium]|nr:hypothetical protein [Lachnospiraceae bacterium]
MTAIGFALIFMFILGSCGKSSLPDITTISISKEGKVTHTIVEDFPEGEYDSKQLKESLESQVTEYNAKTSEQAAKLQKFEVKDGKARVVLEYATPQDFCNMNDNSPVFYYFYGTVAEAEQKGIVPEALLYKDGNIKGVSVNANGIRKYPERHFMVLMESAHVVLPQEILFCTANVKPLGEGVADAVIKEPGEKAYILTD